MTHNNKNFKNEGRGVVEMNVSKRKRRLCVVIELGKVSELLE